MRYLGQGKLAYSVQSRVVAWIDEEIARYYRSLIPKAYYVQPQMYPAHITVVRSYPIEIITDRSAWGKYEGRLFNFEYSGEIQYSAPYFYLDAWSEDFAEIRAELGLPRYRPRFDRYHITIGNRKNE